MEEKGEMMDVITPSKPYKKAPEELLPNGTIVTLYSDIRRGSEPIFRTIRNFCPYDKEYEHFPNRYALEDYGFVCGLKDFASIQKPGGMKMINNGDVIITENEEGSTKMQWINLAVVYAKDGTKTVYINGEKNENPEQWFENVINTEK